MRLDSPLLLDLLERVMYCLNMAVSISFLEASVQQRCLDKLAYQVFRLSDTDERAGER